MKENKHIDRLFQEGFKDFEAQPDPSVWKNIEKELMERKNKKRILPLWFRIAGAAVVLFGLVTLGYVLVKNDTDTNIPQHTVPQNDPIITDTDTKDPKKPTTTEETAVSTNTEIDNSTSPKSETVGNDTEIAQKETVKDSEKRKTDAVVHGEKNAIGNQNKISTDTKPVQNTETIAVIRDKDKGETDKSEKEKSKSTDDGLIAEDTYKKDVQEEVNKLKEKTMDITDSKWTIGSVIAPVYFNSFSDGSPVSPALDENSKSGNNTLAYGVKVNYKISDKFSIQSGINSVDLSYTTNNVAPLISAISGSENANIQTNGSKVEVAFVSTLQTVSDASGYRTSYDVNGSLEQNYGYIEVPVEAKYNLLERKVGINVVGGFSTYFLKDNELVVTSFWPTIGTGQSQ